MAAKVGHCSINLSINSPYSIILLSGVQRNTSGVVACVTPSLYNSLLIPQDSLDVYFSCNLMVVNKKTCLMTYSTKLHICCPIAWNTHPTHYLVRQKYTQLRIRLLQCLFWVLSRILCCSPISLGICERRRKEKREGCQWGWRVDSQTE